ncbi:DUF4344 domain-containing metallopeptidase [Halodesulfovibrio sp.]|jgi:hypothetical protein|uniref:DUF4344 domain-containing metallopeptidase n=1 Tax=Halodesulfovibrio sp. TaxID=1912772 RepID=UPI0025E734A7|nr:DUF4344 domain-containing metallopeptidase [Halodesulfovibrio sp.]MCT4626721.1 DUF4344 domain-containing metallopeptidase [Halodesulfovibrio sp.]
MRTYYVYIARTTAALFFILAVCALLTPTTVSAKGRLRVIYDLPEPEDINAARIIYQSEVAEEIAQIVEEWSLLKKDVTLRFGTVLGPHFAVLDNGKLEIHIPYDFFSNTQKLFAAKKYAETKDATTAALNSLHHTIYHELGHAIIHSQPTGIPAQLEEHAVDTLSAILLISIYEDGAEIASSAAKAFQLLATETESPLHTKNDIQRFQEINCLVYGSNPRKYAALLEDLPTMTESICPTRFQKTHKQWEQIFKIALPD